MKYQRLGRLHTFIKDHLKMITALFIIGIIAVVLTIVVWFTPLSDTQVDVRSTVPISLNTPEFYTAVESITHSPVFPIGPGEEVKILNNGDEFIPDLLSEIKNAKHSVTLANYIWKKGDLTNELFDALTAKAKEGVQVRLLMDATGGSKAPSDKVDALIAAGGKVAKFRPLGFKTITRTNKRTHMRAMIVDGSVGYIGGVAFDDEWLGNGMQPKEWRDIMFKFKGQGARSIQNMFNDLWRQTDGEILSGSDFYPTLPPVTVGDSCTTSCFVSLSHSPTPDLEKNLYQFFWLSISGAKDHIYMETPYLLPNGNILEALKQKVKEGVEVDIIVPGPYVDSKIVQLASRSYYKEMLDAGIHIYEYQPAHLHSKVMTADGHWSVVGSANLDNRSSTLNVEGIMGIEDKKLARGIEEQFLLDKSRSVEVSKDTFKVQVLDRLFGRISRLFAKQY
jgi:cardiolipin synthase